MRHSFSCKEFLYINHDLIRLRDSSVLSHTLVASRTPTKQTWYIATSQAYKHTEADRDSRLHTALSNTQVRTRKTTRTDTSAVKTECGGTNHVKGQCLWIYSDPSWLMWLSGDIFRSKQISISCPNPLSRPHGQSSPAQQRTTVWLADWWYGAERFILHCRMGLIWPHHSTFGTGSEHSHYPPADVWEFHSLSLSRGACAQTGLSVYRHEWLQSNHLATSHPASHLHRAKTLK